MRSNWKIESLGNYISQQSIRNRSLENMEVYSVTNSKGFTKSTEYFSKEIFSKDLSNYKIVKRNQFAYNPSRINVGSIACLSNADFALVSPLYIVFEVDKNHLFPDYLLRYLKSHYGNVQIRNNTEGSVRDSLKYKGLEKIKVPIPPLNDQIRIATVLTRTEDLITKRTESIKALDELLKSVFLEMFGNPLKNEKGWEKKRIDEIANTRLGKMRDKQFFTGKHLNYYLGNSNVRWFSFDFDKLEKMDFDEKEQVKFSLQYGDLLICEGGEIGRCAVWKCEKKNIYFQKALHRVRVNNELVHPEYLAYVFYLYSLGNGFKNATNKATISHLTGEKLKETLVPIPPLLLQKQFVAMVRAVDSLKAKYNSSLKELENLYGSLCQRAFKGELDLGRIPLETHSESIELKEKKREISSVNIELTELKESKKYAEAELLQIIQSLPGETFSFNTLMIAIEAASFVQMPEYDEVREQIYRMLEGENPVLSQYFDTTKREIMLRVNT